MTPLIQGLKEFLLTSRKGVSDVAASIAPQIISIFSYLGTSIILARGLGAEAVGGYALIYNYYGFIVGVSDFGIGVTAIRFASICASEGDEGKQFEVLRWAFRVRIVSASLFTAAAFYLAPFVFGRLWKSPDLILLARAGLAVAFFNVISTVAMIYFQSIKNFIMYAFVSSFQMIIPFAGVAVIYFLNRMSLEYVIGINVAASVFCALVFLILVPGRAFIGGGTAGRFRSAAVAYFFRAPRIKKQDSGELLGDDVGRFFFFMFLSAIIVAIAVRVDVWLMGALLTKAQVGLYSVAMWVTVPVRFISEAISTAIRPRASAMTDLKSTLDFLKRIFKPGVFLAVLCVVYAAGGPVLMPFVFGAEYGGGILIARLLCLKFCVTVLSSPFSIIAYNFGIVRINWIISAASLILYTILNVMLIPLIGALAPAVLLLLFELLVFPMYAAIVFFKAKSMRAAET
ncbi:MAG: oligosaccharide flippase family protein [bacterium]